MSLSRLVNSCEKHQPACRYALGLFRGDAAFCSDDWSTAKVCCLRTEVFFLSSWHIRWKHCCVAWGTSKEEFPFYMLCVDVKCRPDQWKIRHLNSDVCWPYVMEANKHLIVNTFATFHRYIFSLFSQWFRSVCGFLLILKWMLTKFVFFS